MPPRSWPQPSPPSSQHRAGAPRPRAPPLRPSPEHARRRTGNRSPWAPTNPGSDERQPLPACRSRQRRRPPTKSGSPPRVHWSAGPRTARRQTNHSSREFREFGSSRPEQDDATWRPHGFRPGRHRLPRVHSNVPATTPASSRARRRSVPPQAPQAPGGSDSWAAPGRGCVVMT